MLTEPQCLELLASARVGRLVYTDRAMPAVLPVGFSIADGAIVTSPLPGIDLPDVVDDAVVAFAADDIDPSSMAGWHVTVIGHAALLGGTARVAIEVLTGRRWL